VRKTNTIFSMTTVHFVALFLSVIMLFPDAASAQVPNTEWYGDGSASAFEISTADELAGLAELTNTSPFITFDGKTITLTANIDLKDYKNGTGWTPISTQSNVNRQFRGTFDGAGHIITNLKINNPSATQQGLFARVRDGAVVKDLAIIDVYINASGTVGSVVATLGGG